MELLLRQEQPGDYREVENLTREAFWNQYGPGCDEHYFAHVLRDSSAVVKELDIVAVYDGKIVGNIMYTRATVVGEDGVSHPVLCFGPLSVLPEYQGKGIGQRLIADTKRRARELGFLAILIMGDPRFYEKAGFVPAKTYQIGTSEKKYAAALQALELVPGALSSCGGYFYESDVFQIDPTQAEAFDKMFPPKVKQSGLPSQLRFEEIVAMCEPMHGCI